MTETPNKPSPPAYEVRLVSRLIELARKEDRGALAALRSGLGKPPGAAARMLPIVAPFLTRDDGPSTVTAFLTAALFGKHPKHADIGSLGASLWRATKREGNPGGKHGEEGVEARFVAALDADPEDLPRHLEGLVSLCESADVPVDWHLFLRDVRALISEDEKRRLTVRTRWARHFWQGPPRPTTQTDSEPENQSE